MGNYGIKCARAGYSAPDAADDEMLLHSAFFNLGIVSQGAFTNVAAGETIYTHNLGYAPAFDVFITNGGYNYLLPAALPGGTFPRSCMVTTTVLRNATVGEGGSTITGYYFVFKERLDENLSATNLQTTSTTPGSDSADRGIKIARAGYNAPDAALNELSVISGRKVANETARLEILHMKATGTLSGNIEVANTVIHNLGYRARVKWFIKITGGEWQAVRNADDSFINNGTNTTNLHIGYTGSYSCLVFKNRADN